MRGGHRSCFETRGASPRGITSKVTQPGGALARPAAPGSEPRPRSGSLWSSSRVLTSEEAGRGLHAPGGRQAHQDAGEALTGSRPQLPVTQTNARALPPGKAHTLPGSRLTDAATRPQPRCPGLAVSRKARGDEAGGERLTVTRQCDLLHWQTVCERLLLAEGPEVVTGSPWPSCLHPAYTHGRGRTLRWPQGPSCGRGGTGGGVAGGRLPPPPRGAGGALGGGVGPGQP